MGITQDRRDAQKRAKQQEAIEAYLRLGEPGPAMRAIGMSRGTWYRWIEEDPEFARMAEEAEQEVCDFDKAEVRRRAVDGVEEPVGWWRGKPGGYVRKYSDNLLMFRVKAKDPAYRDRTEITGAGGAPLTVQFESVLDADAAARLAAKNG
jgi:hypothetical protein